MHNIKLKRLKQILFEDITLRYRQVNILTIGRVLFSRSVWNMDDTNGRKESRNSSGRSEKTTRFNIITLVPRNYEKEDVQDGIL